LCCSAVKPVVAVVSVLVSMRFFLTADERK
jgi:hypothetical protein